MTLGSSLKKFGLLCRDYSRLSFDHSVTRRKNKNLIPRSVPSFPPSTIFDVFPRFPGFLNIFVKKKYISVFHGRQYHVLSLIILNDIGEFIKKFGCAWTPGPTQSAYCHILYICAHISEIYIVIWK